MRIWRMHTFIVMWGRARSFALAITCWQRPTEMIWMADGESTAASYRFRYYCDICKEGSDWAGLEQAEEWRESHFTDEHPDNPMVKVNSRIQRRADDE